MTGLLATSNERTEPNRTRSIDSALYWPSPVVRRVCLSSCSSEFAPVIEQPWRWDARTRDALGRKSHDMSVNRSSHNVLAFRLPLLPFRTRGSFHSDWVRPPASTSFLQRVLGSQPFELTKFRSSLEYAKTSIPLQCSENTVGWCFHNRYCASALITTVRLSLGCECVKMPVTLVYYG